MSNQVHTYFISSERYRSNLQQFINKLPLMDPGTRKNIVWKVSVQRSSKRRSHPQNALLHKWFDVIAQHTGYSAGEVKELLCLEFLPTRVITIGGFEREMRAETSKLSVVEMQGFMTQIEAWSAGLGLMLPTGEPEPPESQQEAA